jgi:hypothetical protein
MLIELAGHRLMVLGAPLSLGTPKGVDVLLVASQDAIAAVSDAGPRAVVAGSAELASQLRGWLKGTPIWSTPHFDVGELRPR